MKKIEHFCALCRRAIRAYYTRCARITFQIKYFDITYPFYQYQLRMTKHCGDMNYNVFSQNGA